MNLRDVIHTCRCISLFLFMCGKAAEVNKLLKRVSATQVKAIREAWLYCTSVCCDSSMDEIMRGDKGLKWATLPLLLWVLINWLLLFTLLFVGYSQHLAINWKNRCWNVPMVSIFHAKWCVYIARWKQGQLITLQIQVGSWICQSVRVRKMSCKSKGKGKLWYRIVISGSRNKWSIVNRRKRMFSWKNKIEEKEVHFDCSPNSWNCAL